MADLGAGDERFRNDHGEADPAVSAALAAYADRTGDEHAVLTALAGSRLLVPVVAVLAEEVARDDASGDTSGGAGGQQAGPDGHVPGPGAFPGGEKASEMAMPVIVARDGRRALPAFTCAAAVRQWKPEGRPVPVAAAGVWQSAVQESCAVIIDIAGPVPLAVEGSRLAALAEGQVLALHEDPDVWQLVVTAAAEFAPGVRVRLSPPRGGLDFTLEVAPPDGATWPVPDEAASQLGDAVTARLGERVRTGIAVLVRPPA